jgi:Zn-finger nucleic acid-binding protein
MQCPSCQSVLVMSERKGVEIDYCPQCRGVWLDRGELDKIIDRALDSEIAAEARGAGASAATPGVGAPVPPPPPVPPSYGGLDDHRGYDRGYDRRYDDKRYDDKRYDEKRYDERRYDTRYDDRYRRDDEYRRRKKKESFLGDLFDF